MNFYDCNAFIGRPAHPGIYPPTPCARDILTEMDYCGVSRALIWHIAQRDSSPQAGNAILARELTGQTRLAGCWAVLPNQAHEFPSFETFLCEMRAANIKAIRAFPVDHHFFLNEVAMGSWLEPMVRHKLPLFISVTNGANWDIVYSLLREFPQLVVVICDHGCWGEDRRFRPLIERYPNVTIDTAQYLLDGGIEAFVADYGFKRMLFGSGFPVSHFGGMMLAIKHSRISEEAKLAIAGQNLERILSEVAL